VLFDAPLPLLRGCRWRENAPSSIVPSLPQSSHIYRRPTTKGASGPRGVAPDSSPLCPDMSESYPWEYELLKVTPPNG
jgi:hypothetical protein